MDAAAIYDQIAEASAQLAKATAAAAELLRVSRTADDEWLRLPPASDRCPISGFSRSHIVRLTKAGTIRKKSVGAAAFYSGADLREYLAK